MAGEGGPLLSGCFLPAQDRAVGAAGVQGTIIGSESHGVHSILVTTQQPNARARGRVPQFGAVVAAGRGQSISIVSKPKLINGCLVCRPMARFLASLDIPKSHRAVVA